MLSVLVFAPLLAQQRGGPIAPGPSVAGHWTGKMVLVLSASKREVTVPLDFTLEQDGNIVMGKLTFTSSVDHTEHSIPVKGIEEAGKLNLVSISASASIADFI